MNSQDISNPPVNHDLCQEGDADKDLLDPKTKSTNRERKRAVRWRSKVVRRGGTPPKNFDDKFIARLGTFAMHQLIRRLKQAARASSHFKHLIARSDSYSAGKYRPLHDHALMCFVRVQTEIEFRTSPKEV